MHPTFDLTEIRTRDQWIADSTFHVPEALVLTTEPSGACMTFLIIHIYIVTSLAKEVMFLVALVCLLLPPWQKRLCF